MDATFAVFKSLSFEHFRKIFYLASPNETTFENLQHVPNYIDDATPWMILLMAIEIMYSYIKKKDLFHVNDALTNGYSGMMQQAIKTLFCGFEFSMACWIYEHYGLRILPWDSVWTWIIAFLVVDLSFYWFHRASHEINFFWAFHQVHHSSEHFNLTTAFRQGMIEQYISIFFYLPEAFILPPPVHLARLMLNKINQFWVHTQTIKSLGPLEYIFVTPSTHRVHHGRNPYCIDKNYAGNLIIWDRIFGTFQAEKAEEPVVFGLVHNVNTFNVLHVQFHYFKYLFLEKVPSMTNFMDKAKALVYGPGWLPGAPRLGNLSDIPEIEYPVVKYDQKIHTYIWLYCQLHFGLNFFIYFTLLFKRDNLSFLEALLYVIMFLISVQCSSAFLDKKSYAPQLELLRLTVMYFWFFKIVWPPNDVFHALVKYLYGASFLFWLVHQIIDNLLKINIKLKNQ